MKLSISQSRMVVRSSALFDLVVTAPFATPWTLALVHSLVFWLDGQLNLPGSVPAFGLFGVLFANLMGSVVLVWAIVRWISPTAFLGRMDAVARALFSAWQVYAVTQGASMVLLVFTLFELLFLVAQVWPVKSET